MKDPAFLFYSSDFISGTAFMTDEQIGKYLRLLCFQHIKGHLKEEHMLQICKTYEKDIFDNFKKDENGLFFNERLEFEINKRIKYSESRRNNRKKKDTEEKKEEIKKDMNNICNSYDEHMENENENRNIYNCSNSTLSINNEKFEKIYPESILVNEIIKDYNLKFKKSYIISNKLRMSIARICNEGNLNLEHWQTIFDNALRGWTIDGKSVKPSLDYILENWESVYADDCNFNKNVAKIEKEKAIVESEKEKELQIQKQIEKAEHEEYLAKKAEVKDKVSALTLIADVVPKLAWKNSSTVKEYRQKFDLTNDEILGAYEQKEKMAG